jgi:alanine racemase
MSIYINKKTLHNNLEILTRKFNKIPAFVLKSDAYGLGIKNILPLLLEGYNHLINKNYNSPLQVFVKDIKEAIIVRKIHNQFIKKHNPHELTKKINIIVLASVEKKYINFYKKYNIIPLINSEDDLNSFKEFFSIYPTILNIDVGMNRTGIKYNLIEKNLSLLKNLNLIGIKSHLHITSSLNIHDINYMEKDRFQKILSYFPHINNITLASSNVLDYGNDFIYSQPRIGKALYGINHKDYGLKEIITFKLTVCQVNKVLKGEVVGYNGYEVLEDAYIGVFNVGYSNGISLNLLNKTYVKYENSLYGIISISMEYIMVDFKNTNINMGETVILFPDGFLKSILDTYYLEQLLRFASMNKIIY